MTADAINAAPRGAACTAMYPRCAGGENSMQAKAYILAISLSLATLGVAQAQRVLGPMTPSRRR